MRRIGSRRKVESSRQSAGLRIERIEKLTGGRLGRLEVRGWRQSLPEEEGGIWGEREDESWGKEAKKKRSKRKEMKDKEEEARKEERRNATMERG